MIIIKAMKELDKLQDLMIKAGNAARENQKGIKSDYKSDGSPVTQSDLMITRLVLDYLGTSFSDCNIVSEEEDHNTMHKDAEYTFVLDPLDGTDVYSQGLPSWTLALGILDRNLRPCGAMIYAPRFGVGEESLLMRSDPDWDEVLINGKRLVVEPKRDIRQLTIGSHCFRLLDLSAYHGKMRIFGSAILQLVCPLIFFRIAGAIDDSVYPWDMCASWALLEKCGYHIYNKDKTLFSFTPESLFGRRKLGTIIACHPDQLASISSLIL